MATVQEPRPRAKYDALLEAHLRDARGRVRTADLLVGGLGLAGLTLTFGLVMILVDRVFELPDVVRQLALGGFLVAAVLYVVKVLVRPMTATVNPYYAARRVEETIPEAKNSLVTWLDLKNEPLAPTVREAVSRKAAEDVGHADFDEATHDSRLTALGVFTGVLAVTALVLFFAFRPAQFMSLMSRTFLPFGGKAIAAQTGLTLLEPAEGNVTIPIHQSVTFKVEISGRVPKPEDADAVRLRLRYNPEDPNWEEKRLELTEQPREWALRLPSAQVRTGFEYQLAAGDAETPVYRVRVRAKPLVTDFEVVYRYRPYLRFPDDKSAMPNLKAVRGTEVTILAKTNRAVRDGSLKFTATGPEPAEQVIAAERLPDRPDTLKYVLKLERDGHYRLKFTAADKEESDETLPYEVKVLPENAPVVEFTKPAPERLAVNGTLAVSGRATDDYGLTAARLVMKLRTLPGGPAEDLKPVVHRGGAPLTLADGALPRTLEWAEVVPLDSLTDAAGGKLPLRPGAVLEYHLEADDNFDDPKPQTGKSPVRTVVLADPQDAQKRDDERAAAERQKQQAEARNDAEQNQPPQKPEGAGQPPNEPPHNPADKPSDAEQQGDQQRDEQTLKKAQELAEAMRRQQQGNNAQPQQQPGANDQDAGSQAPAGPQPPTPTRPAEPQPNNRPAKAGPQPPNTQPQPPAAKSSPQPPSPGRQQQSPQADGQPKDGNNQGLAPPQPAGQPKADSAPNAGQKGNEQRGEKSGSEAGAEQAQPKNQADQPQDADANQPKDQRQPQGGAPKSGDGQPNAGAKANPQAGDKQSPTNRPDGQAQPKSQAGQPQDADANQPKDQRQPQGGAPKSGDRQPNAGAKANPQAVDKQSPTNRPDGQAQPKNQAGQTQGADANQPKDQRQPQGGSPKSGDAQPNAGAKANPQAGDKQSPANRTDGQGQSQVNQPAGAPKSGDGAKNKPQASEKPSPANRPDGQGQSQPKAGDGPKTGSPKKESGQPKQSGGQPQAKSDPGESQPKGAAEPKSGDGKPSISEKSGQPDEHGGSAKPQSKAGGEPKTAPGGPQQPKPSVNSDAGAKSAAQPQPGHREEGNAQANPQPGEKPNEGKAAPKTNDARDNKSGENSDRTGEKTGPGVAQKPNDQQTKTSPDKGNAEGGKDGSQRTDRNPNAKDKADKPDGKAKSGRSDPNANPGDKGGDKASANPGQPKGDNPAAKPDGGQPGRPDAAAPKGGTIQDAAKPHDKAGQTPSVQPKSGGIISKDQKLELDTTKPSVGGPETPEEELNRWLEMCDKCKKLARDTNDAKLAEKAAQVEKKAWETYRKRFVILVDGEPGEEGAK